MPANKAGLLKRKLAQAYRHQQLVADILLEESEIFGEFHKDYEEYFKLIAANTFVTLRFIQDIGTKAWGYWPDDITKWL